MTDSKLISSKPAQRPKRRSQVGGVKGLIFSLSLVITLGLWSLLSKQLDLYATAASPAALAASGSLPPAQTSSGLALNLPPIPTLIPQAAAKGQTAAAAPQTGQQVAQQAQVPAAPQAPVKIFLGGAQPVAPAAAPVTRTRSSR
ncbi:MAG TPA: hypothetical protein VF498_05745 [Anaerolineales bacterium]